MILPREIPLPTILAATGANPFDSGASIARIKSSRVFNGGRRQGRTAIDQGRYGDRVALALCAGRQGRERTIRSVVWRGYAARLRWSYVPDRRAEPMLSGVDSHELPPAHRG